MADSQPECSDLNIESLWSLEKRLSAQDYDLLKTPYVLQLNKRDLPGMMSVPDLTNKLRRKDEPVFEAVAYKGTGVRATFNSVVSQIVEKIKTRDIHDDLRLFPPKPFEVLVATLQTATEADERAEAAVALGASAAVRAVDPLIGALGDESSVVRAQAVRALGKIDAEAGFESLIYMFRDPEALVRLVAAETIGAKRDLKALPFLLELLRDETASVRSGVVEYLVHFNDERIVPALIETLKDDNAAVRSRVAEGLGRIGYPQAIPALIENLSDTNAYARAETAEALGRIKDGQAIKPLESLLNDPDSNVREKVMTALRHLKTHRQVLERQGRRGSSNGFFKNLWKRLRQ